MQRFKEALGGNPVIKFVATWKKFVATWKIGIEKPADAGEHLANGFSREKFGTAAHEWFRARNIDDLIERGDALFGPPSYTQIPDKILNHSPWDPFGNMPKEGTGASCLWLHRKRRRGGALKISDNSWWAPNLKATWNSSFNPTGFDLVAAFVWPNLQRQRPDWSNLNRETRTAKYKAHNIFGVPGLPRIAEIGWLACNLTEVTNYIGKLGEVLPINRTVA